MSLIHEAEACNPPLRPADIGIMTPWREQVWRLRERLRNEKLHAVDVGTVEVSSVNFFSGLLINEPVV